MTKPAHKTAAKPPPSPEATLQANVRANLPDVNTAAALAATLAGGRPIDKASAADLAGQAIDLWQAAKSVIGKRFGETLAAHAKSLAWARRFDRVPRGVGVVTFPLSWRDFGKLLLPKSRSEDRVALVRHFREARGETPDLLAAERIETDFDYYELAPRFLEWSKRDAKAKDASKAAEGGRIAAARKLEAHPDFIGPRRPSKRKNRKSPLTRSRPRKK